MLSPSTNQNARSLPGCPFARSRWRTKPKTHWAKTESRAESTFPVWSAAPNYPSALLIFKSDAKEVSRKERMYRGLLKNSDSSHRFDSTHDLQLTSRPLISASATKLVAWEELGLHLTNPRYVKKIFLASYLGENSVRDEFSIFPTKEFELRPTRPCCARVILYLLCASVLFGDETVGEIFFESDEYMKKSNLRNHRLI